MRIQLRHPSHGTVVAYLALFVAMSGTAVATTGGVFVLGQRNLESRPASLVNTRDGAR